MELQKRPTQYHHHPPYASISLVTKIGRTSVDWVSLSSPLSQLYHPEKSPGVCQPRQEMGEGVHQLFGDELGWRAP